MPLSPYSFNRDRKVAFNQEHQVHPGLSYSITDQLFVLRAILKFPRLMAQLETGPSVTVKNKIIIIIIMEKKRASQCVATNWLLMAPLFENEKRGKLKINRENTGT